MSVKPGRGWQEESYTRARFKGPFEQEPVTALPAWRKIKITRVLLHRSCVGGKLGQAAQFVPFNCQEDLAHYG